MASERNTHKTDLTDDDIEFIMANTDFDREKILQWYNDFKRQCPSGRLNKEEFIKFYKKLIKGDHPDEDRFCAAVFDVFDSDGNGSIDFGEFLIAFWVRAKGSVKDKLAWLFDIYDCDKSNYITQWEMSKMLRLVLNMKGINEDPYAKAKSIMAQLDRSGDGKISKQEFIAGCTRDAKLRSLFSPF
jgi:Ca2+-binding EF-hand superfamily protein